MPKKNNPGCKCCGCSVTRTIHVTGCGSAISGVSVSITGPAGTVSGTTDGSGNVTFTGLTNGSYTGSASGATHYDTATFSFSIASTCTPSTATINVNLTPSSGYSCSILCCTPSGSPPYAAVTWPTTIYVNDGIGTVTCTSASSASPGPWFGVASRTASAGFSCSTYDSNGGIGGTTGSGSTNVYFEVGCDGATSLYVRFGMYPCKSSISGCMLSTGVGAGRTGPRGPAVAGQEDTTCTVSGTASSGARSSLTTGTSYGANETQYPSLKFTPDCPPTAISYSTSVNVIAYDSATGGLTFTDTIGLDFSKIYGLTAPISGFYYAPIPITVTS